MRFDRGPLLKPHLTSAPTSERHNRRILFIFPIGWSLRVGLPIFPLGATASATLLMCVSAVPI